MGRNKYNRYYQRSQYEDLYEPSYRGAYLPPNNNSNASQGQPFFPNDGTLFSFMLFRLFVAFILDAYLNGQVTVLFIVLFCIDIVGDVIRSNGRANEQKRRAAERRQNDALESINSIADVFNHQTSPSSASESSFPVLSSNDRDEDQNLVVFFSLPLCTCLLH